MNEQEILSEIDNMVAASAAQVEASNGSNAFRNPPHGSIVTTAYSATHVESAAQAGFDAGDGAASTSAASTVFDMQNSIAAIDKDVAYLNGKLAEGRFNPTTGVKEPSITGIERTKIESELYSILNVSKPHAIAGLVAAQRVEQIGAQRRADDHAATLERDSMLNLRAEQIAFEKEAEERAARLLKR